MDIDLPANIKQARELYLKANEYRRQQDWTQAMNLYDQAAALDSTSPAVAAREMLKDIMNYYCKDYYNP